jgi:hypothetical protein
LAEYRPLNISPNSLSNKLNSNTDNIIITPSPYTYDKF